MAVVVWRWCDGAAGDGGFYGIEWLLVWGGDGIGVEMVEVLLRCVVM